jgi:DeoR family transcriptional regulator of aga operon
MCRAAREVIVVADSSKFGRVCLHKILETSGVSKLVTDAGISTATRDELARCGVEVIVA